jgi:hypothetical protein
MHDATSRSNWWYPSVFGTSYIRESFSAELSRVNLPAKSTDIGIDEGAFPELMATLVKHTPLIESLMTGSACMQFDMANELERRSL